MIFDPDFPVPGIYLDVDNEAYHEAPGVSKSGLALVADSPEKYHSKYILREQERPKAHYKHGSAFHTATLEPDKFPSAFVVGPDVNKNSNVWKAFVADNSDRTILGVEEYGMVMRMADKVHKHPVAKGILTKGYAEASVFAIDPETGQLVKVRPDWITEDIIVDLKSAADASPDKFFRDMFTLSYHMQAAMYPEVVNLVSGVHVNDFVFIVVEKEKPHSIGVYRASEEDRQIGMQMYRHNLRKYAECKAARRWPGYNDDMIIDTELPYWAKKQAQAAILNDPSATF